jgi:hypothetical protein
MHQGWPIIIHVEAEDAEGDAIEYRYFVQGQEIHTWTTQDTITWLAEDSDIGEKDISVEVRSGGQGGIPTEEDTNIFRRPVVTE